MSCYSACGVTAELFSRSVIGYVWISGLQADVVHDVGVTWSHPVHGV